MMEIAKDYEKNCKKHDELTGRSLMTRIYRHTKLIHQYRCLNSGIDYVEK
jgi:hypothetical protein